MPQPGLLANQNDLDVHIKCAAIPEAIVLKAEITESISNLFQADVFIQTQKQVDISNIVNSIASISLKIDENISRYFSGIIEQASFENIPSQHQDKPANAYNIHNILYVKIVPTLARTLYAERYRSFQELTAKTIIEQILKENKVSKVKMELQSAGTNVRTFCVQYGESDFHFISRLMEEEGIFYYFEHDDSGDILHISENSASSKKIKTDLKIRKTATNTTLPLDSVYNVSFSNSLGFKKIDLFSYNEDKAAVISGASSDSSDKVKIGERELYNQLFLEKTVGDKISRTILESDNSFTKKLTGYSYCPEISPGVSFKISGSTTPAHNGDFLVVSVKHTIDQLTENRDNVIYHNSFIAIPDRTPFKPSRTHLKNRIFGCQTATVTGTAGEEIYCDERARIKVKFHWDSRSQKDEKSSCWIRIAQSWAGNKFGALVIPRVGMEVLVEFINGDPDQPLVTGCLYNGVEKPPSNYAKEQNTVSTFYTNSSKGGAGFNELRFNDKKDNEEIFIHAQKDINSVVENSVSEILNEGSKTITLESKKDPTTHLLTIKKGDNKVVINDGNYVVLLDKGNQTITLTEGNQTVTLSNGNLNIDVTGSISIKATKDISIESDAAVNIKSKGDTSVKSNANVSIDASASVKIKCMKYTAKASTSVELSGLTCKVQANTNLQFIGFAVKVQATTALNITAGISSSIKSGAMTNIMGGAGVALSGAMIKLG